MALITLADASRQWSVSRSTLNRYLKKGQLSAIKEGRHRKIDTSEMLRVFGEAKGSGDTSDTVAGGTEGHTEAHSEALDLLRNQVKQLEQQLEKAQDSEGELRELLKREQDNFKMLVDGREKQTGIFARWFGR